jgi:hypothetical protein
MPRATSAISERDLEVLDFVARFGLVPSSEVAVWAQTAQTVSYSREGRWLAHGLVEALEPINGSGRLLVCTREGLRAVGREALGPGRVSVGRRPHAIAVAQVAAALEREGFAVLSERELSAAEAEERRRIYSAELPGGRFHRPDLVMRDHGVAIEVELSQKGSWRLDSILRAWRSAIGAGRFEGIRYLCGERALRPVRKAVVRTATDELIEVDALSRMRENANGHS